MSGDQVNPADLRQRQDEVTAGEHTPLVVRSQSPWPFLLARRYRSTRKCVSSKAALLILVWSFVIGLLGGMFLNPDVAALFVYYVDDSASYLLSIYAIITCFFPLAGILADVKFGRYKTVVTSICTVLLSLLFLSVGISVFTLYLGLIGFTANVVQFGMEQLHDSSGEDRTLFIHWYVWTYFGSMLIVELGSWNVCFLIVIYLTPIIVLPITLCLVRRRRRWFLIEPGQYNPYKLVYRVTKFARQHKTPVDRSAFTYCEDEVPMGLDLGKEKYGGPFTIEQVEDVKAFYGILKVLFSYGVVFFLGFAADSTLHYYTMYSYYSYYSYDSSLALRILIHQGLLSPLLKTICIPLYLCLLRPVMSQEC